MANQLKKKFLGDDQVDGSKILIESGQSIKAKDSLGVEQDLVKFGASDEVLVKGQEVAIKSESVQKSGDTMTGALVLENLNPANGSSQIGYAGAEFAGISAKQITNTDPAQDLGFNSVKSNVNIVAGDDYNRDGSPGTVAKDIILNATSGFIDATGSKIKNIASGSAADHAVNKGQLDSVQNELDATQLGAGLGTDGSYSPNTFSPIIASATSLKNADDALDLALQNVITLSGTNVNDSDLGSFTGTTIPDGQSIKSALQSLESAVEAVSGGGSSTQLELDATQLGAGLNTDGSYTPPAGANYISASTSLKDADSDLDSAIKGVQDELDLTQTSVGLDSNGSLTISGTHFVSNTVKGILEDLDSALTGIDQDVVDLQNEDLTFLKLDGSRPMQANLNMMDGLTHYKIVGLENPSDPRDAVNKQYVDSIAEGLHVHAPAKVILTQTLASFSGGSVVYSNGSSGVGATLTLGSAISSIDSYSLQNGDRVIIAGEANQAHNGIYTWATGGTVLTRASDFDTVSEAAGGDFIFVQEGTTYGSSGWVMTETTSAIGTSPIAFVQFSGAGQLLEGDAIDLNGNEVNVLYDNSSIGVNGSNQLYVKALGIAEGMLQDDSVTNAKIADNAVQEAQVSSSVAGVAMEKGLSGKLDVKSDGVRIGVNGSNQLYIPNNGVDSAELKASSVTEAKIATDAVTESKIAATALSDGLQKDSLSGKIEVKLDGASLSVSASGLKSNIVWDKAYFDLSPTDISNGYVEFPAGVIAEAGSVIGFVDRLAIHEDEDFTVSVVSGKTRITFAGDLIAPGQSQLDANDNLFFKFQKKAI